MFDMYFLCLTVVAAALQYIASEPEVDRKLFEEIETVLGDKDVNGTSIDNLVYVLSAGNNR